MILSWKERTYVWCDYSSGVVLVDEVNKQKINNSFALMKHNHALWVGMQVALNCCLPGREVQSPIWCFAVFFSIALMWRCRCTLCVCLYVSVSQKGDKTGGATKINGANLQSYPTEWPDPPYPTFSFYSIPHLSLPPLPFLPQSNSN